MNLTRLVDVKEYLSIENSKSDDLINNLIARMSRFIENYCERDFELKTWTEQHDGARVHGGTLILNNFPVTTVSKLWDDISRQFAEADKMSTDYYVVYHPDGSIQLLDGREFTSDFQNIKVEYEAGFAEASKPEDLPEDLQQACIELISVKLNLKGRENLKNERISRWGAGYGVDESLPATIQDILDMYKFRKVVMI